MKPGSDVATIAFEGDRCIGSGDLPSVVRAAKQTLDRRKDASILIFDGATSGLIEIDFRGPIADVLARLPGAAAPPAAMEDTGQAPPRGPGRPKLGVVAREVTLLPRHWEWLAQQTGGASVALRRLVDEARRANKDKDRIRQAQEAAYRFIAAMAENFGRCRAFRDLDGILARRCARSRPPARRAGVRACGFAGKCGRLIPQM
jgi:hypothetical protein